MKKLNSSMEKLNPKPEKLSTKIKPDYMLYDVYVTQVSAVKLGLAPWDSHPTQFGGVLSGDDPTSPGAFRQPDTAFMMAQEDLASTDWQSEVDGLGAMVRLIVFHPDLILAHADKVVRDLMMEFKNLRSQVTRAALQTAAILMSKLGQ